MRPTPEVKARSIGGGFALLLSLDGGCSQPTSDRQATGSAAVLSPIASATQLAVPSSPPSTSGSASPTASDVAPSDPPMVTLPKGGFQQGAAGATGDDFDWSHWEIVPSFALDVTEVTVVAYRKCIAAGVCVYSSRDPKCNLERSPQFENDPVDCVTWADNVKVQANWYDVNHALELFDNQWSMTRSITNNPNANPYQVASSWDYRGTQDGTVLSGVAGEPDSIWTKCDIQFRLVKFVPCLIDSKDWSIRLTDLSGCNEDAFIQHVSAAANKPECAKNTSVPGAMVVVLSGPYMNTDLGCKDGTMLIPPAAGLTTLNNSTVFVNSLGLNKLNVFAHEIGHSLGLTHNFGDPTALMYPTGGSSTGLDATDCATARSRALLFQSAYQGW